MKKKVLLLAIVALMLTVFDSVPAYAKEAGVAGREEKEAFEADVNAVSGGAVAMGENGAETGEDAAMDKEQETQTEADKTEEEKETVKDSQKDEAEKEKENEKDDKKDKEEKDDKEKKDDKDDKKEDKDKKDDKDSKDKKDNKKDDKEKKEEKKESYSKADLKLLACLIYTEAGNQSYKGKLAVGNVVMNRVKSNQFPNNIEDVVYQSAYSRSYGRRIYQFSVASPSVGTLKKALSVYGKRKGAAEIKMEKECIKAAKAVLEGKDAFDGKNYLFFCRYSSSLASRRSGVKLGAHYFYK
ncbi:MAG: cell wall hydrolase [Lachnospiraceae bacterium]|nr:cell wall hydrolase [Lachnospiraceae bacterium]